MMWFKDPQVLEKMEKWWKECSPGGSCMFNVVTKLKFVKQQLKQRNMDCFKNIFAEKLQTESELTLLVEEIMINGMDDVCY